MYVLGNPLRYTDPSGHFTETQIDAYLQGQYGDDWNLYKRAFQADTHFWRALLMANFGDYIDIPTFSLLGRGIFGRKSPGDDTFTFTSTSGVFQLHDYQGRGPYLLNSSLIGEDGELYEYTTRYNPIDLRGAVLSHIWSQPVYDYSSGIPISQNKYRHVMWVPVQNSWGFGPAADSLGGVGSAVGILTPGLPKKIKDVVEPTSWLATLGSVINNSITIGWSLSVSFSQNPTIWRPPTPPSCLTSVYCGASAN